MPQSEHIIRVKVRAGARKESFVEKGGGFEAAVKEPAEQNRANARVIELLARHLSIPPKRIRIIAGHRSPNKSFSIRR
jgi:uncharacterized protein YggU (UPF0235/DUF167 family)